VVTDFDEALDPEGLSFSVGGEPWQYHANLYLALHKPPGYECSRKPSHHPGVLSLLPHQFTVRATQSVGRLDHDTTGLLLLSDDGAFIHANTSPKRHVPKTYVATVRDPVTSGLTQKLLEGVQLDDEPAPLCVQACRQLDEKRIEVVLDQGKYHQVKRMLAAAGTHCDALHRSAIGGLVLDRLGLEEGQWCYLGPAERALLSQDKPDRSPARAP
jgi:16S rRNA pseudouridine516 synthase